MIFLFVSISIQTEYSTRFNCYRMELLSFYASGAGETLPGFRALSTFARGFEYFNHLYEGFWPRPEVLGRSLKIVSAFLVFQWIEYDTNRPFLDHSREKTSWR